VKSFVLKGNICYSADQKTIRTVEGGYAVCADGMAKGVYETLPEEYAALPVIDHGDMLIIPGLVDLHIHAAQYAYRGTGMDMELMEWLDVNAFPEEGKFADMEYAEKAYSVFVKHMRESASTHFVVMASRYPKSTELLMEKMEEAGLVSLVGKVNMNRGAPDYLREMSEEEAAEETRCWLLEIQGKFRHTKPVLTPRFIPSCTDGLMEILGEIRREFDLPVHSHLSENLGEIEFVRELQPDSTFYGAGYDRVSLFGKDHVTGKHFPTVMGHCIWSGEEEIRMMLENGVTVAHCPACNMNVSSGIAPIRKYLDMGLNVGLGSDIAGGHTVSLFNAMVNAVQVSKLYWRLVDQSCAAITFPEAFHLATKGGGQVFGKVGSFEDGYEFSAVVLDDSSFDRTLPLTVLQRLERAVYLSLDLYGIRAKYCCGERLF